VTRYAAVVLAGGGARRLGGVPKPALDVGGRPLLARVLDAVADADPAIVVGPRVAGLPREPLWTREDPPGAGPVAGLRAAVTLLDTLLPDTLLPDTPRPDPAVVAVLAADLPFLDAPAVGRLRAAVEAGAAAAVLVDDTGRDQYLAAVWSLAALRRALSAVDGDRMSAVYRAASRVARIAPSGYRPGAEPWRDVDDPAGLDRARASWDHSAQQRP
jgi:molybdopterin-guanine dinucleotide biosynthesis protein A